MAICPKCKNGIDLTQKPEKCPSCNAPIVNLASAEFLGKTFDGIGKFGIIGLVFFIAVYLIFAFVL